MSDTTQMSLEEWEDELRREIGSVITYEDIRRLHGKHWAPWNTEATKDTIKHLVDGIGDLNPLYRDEEYAKSTKYGSIIAPPSFLFSVWMPMTTFSRKLPKGIYALLAGIDFKCFRPILKGDSFLFKLISPWAVDVKQTKWGGKTLFVYDKIEYFNQRSELVGVAIPQGVKAQVSEVKASSKNKAVDIYKWTPEELERVYAEQDREEIRQANPRYWEDVKLNEELTPVVSGPVTAFDTAMLFAGIGNYSALADKILRRSPYATSLTNPPDPYTGAWVNHQTMCISPSFSQVRYNIQGAFVLGTHMAARGMSLLTNWMGDDGFLWKFSLQLRKLVLTGDVIWYKGTVVKKYIDDGKCCVDIDARGENQRGEVVHPGSATVILPSRENGHVVYP